MENPMTVARNNDGKFSAYAWPGGYPVFHVTEDCEALCASCANEHGHTDDLAIGFQLTHSGRFCKPNDNRQGEPRVAYRHPLLDRKFGVTSDAQVFTDGELEHGKRRCKAARTH